MTIRPKVYLAGPDVFLPDAVEIGRQKKALCADYGFEGLFPLDQAYDRTLPPLVAAGTIYRANMQLIAAADFGIFNLTPFRGVSADVGTVFELGVFVGLGKPAFGYTNNPDDLIVRLRRDPTVVVKSENGVSIDGSGTIVEDFSNADNLMIDCALSDQGRPLHRLATADPARGLAGFVACLEEARALSPTALEMRRATA